MPAATILADFTLAVWNSITIEIEQQLLVEFNCMVVKQTIKKLYLIHPKNFSYTKIINISPKPAGLAPD